jgi:hypothetical protein
MITRERIASTFEQKAVETITKTVGGKSRVETKTIVEEKLKNFITDVVIRARDRNPVAVDMIRTDRRLLEAVLLQIIAQYEARIPVNVIALLERPASVSRANWAKATNRLAPIPVFSEGSESAAERIAREAFGGMSLLH